MSCKSAILLLNSGSSSVTEGNTIPTGNIARRFGGNLVQSGSGIAILGSGYYQVNATFTIVPSAVGVVGVTTNVDGTALGNASQVYAATASEPVEVVVNTLVRVCGCDQRSFLEFVLSNGSGTVSQSNIIVTKL